VDIAPSAIPFFSIVTVCRNAEKTIRRAGVSLRAQHLRDYEWLVVDGASTDGSLEAVESVEVEGTRVCSEPDRGIYDAMNKAIGMARGKVLYFLNADDELHDPEVLGDVRREFAARPDTEFLFGNIVVRKPDREIFKRYGYINRVTLPFEDLCHQAVFARRTLFARIGRFDLRWPTSADYDWFLRVFASGASVRHIDRRMAFFTAGGAHARDPERLADERRNLRLQYMSCPSLAVGSWISRAAHKSSKLLRAGYRFGEFPNV
jgi:glycosyltransferase involved in cell wall biosynthesis